MPGEDAAPVVIEARDGIGTITLNRPHRLNAFTLELGDGFLAALAAWREDPAVRVVVVRGAGRVFSAGGDVAVMKELVTGGRERTAYFDAPLAAFHRMVLAVRELPKPVLAGVHGAVAGVAFNLMLACDLRLAAEGTRFAQAFVKLGLSPDGGGTYFLPRLVGHARACALTMLPEEIDAAQARDWGLVNWVVPADAFEARLAEVARRLADGPAGALGRTKALLARAFDDSLAEHLEAERRAQIENGHSADFAEGVIAFTEKRPPRFGGR